MLLEYGRAMAGFGGNYLMDFIAPLCNGNEENLKVDTRLMSVTCQQKFLAISFFNLGFSHV